MDKLTFNYLRLTQRCRGPLHSKGCTSVLSTSKTGTQVHVGSTFVKQVANNQTSNIENCTTTTYLYCHVSSGHFAHIEPNRRNHILTIFSRLHEIHQKM
jgi:hypothetical protein